MNLKRAIGGPLLSVVFLMFFVYMISGIQWILDNSADNLTASVSDSVQIEQIIIPALEINAKSAISVESDLNGANRIIFEKDSSLPLPIASLTKLMTAVVVLDNYNPSEIITISQLADAQDPAEQYLKAGDEMSARVFLEIMIIGSSNKAAYVLSEKIAGQNFVGLMNQKAKDLGLENTFFTDSTGLSPENISTTSDLVKLAEHILKNYPEIARISAIRELYVPGVGNIVNTNQLLEEIPGIFFSKTGFTAKANGCLLLAVKPNLINIILGADDRFLEMKKIIDWQTKYGNSDI